MTIHKRNRFKAGHIPQYSKVLIEALKTPLLIYFTLAGNLITFSSAWIFYLVELDTNPNIKNYWDALWWAICTVSTVGYGDIVPHTMGGRLVAFFLIVVGITFFLSFMAVLVSVVSSILAEERNPQ